MNWAAARGPAQETEGQEDDDLDALFDDGLDELLAGAIPSTESGVSTDSALQAWKGFFEIKPRVYLRDRGGEKNDETLILEGEFEFDFRLNDDVTGFFRPRIYLDALDGDLQRFEPFEAYLTLASGDWEWRAGQFVENWGIVDTFNPIDVVNRRDLAGDFLDLQRLGELGFRLRRFFDGGEVIGEPTLSAYYLPVWRPTPFAPEDQRFSFAAPGFRFEEDDGFDPKGSERSFYALRFQGTFDSAPFNADFQFLTSHGPERQPAFFVPTPGVTAPAYFGVTTVGFGFRAVPNRDVAGDLLSTLTLKAELVYKDPFNFDSAPIPEPDDFLVYVLGVDRSFYDVFKTQDQITATLEYAGESGADDPTTILRPFQDDLVLRLLWEPNDFARTSLDLRTIYDLDSDETIFELIFARQLRAIHEDLKFTLGLQLFDPADPGETLFGFFPNNSSLAASLRWDF